MSPSQSFTRNCLLAALSTEDLNLMQPHLNRVSLRRNDVLAPPNEPIHQIYFPEAGIVSIVAIGPGDVRTEVGIFGREGMSSSVVLMETDRTPHETFVQVEVEGMTALAMPCATLIEVIEESRTLRTKLLRYAHCLGLQVATAVAALAALTTERRLARWLVMCHDRIDGDEIALTHEFMSMMLGTRRAGVTDALHVLEGQHLVRARRGLVTIRDRAGLIALAGNSYGQSEVEYERLIGPLPRNALPEALRNRG